MTYQPTINSKQILELLYNKYSDPEWASADEIVTPSGGRIDFWTIHCWGGAGHTIAFEIKTSKADFRNEIKRPEKRTWCEKSARECYFIAPCGVIPVEELPECWGLMEVNASMQIRIKVAAVQRVLDAVPCEFLCYAMRRVSGKKQPVSSNFISCLGQTVTPDNLENFIMVAGKDVVEKIKKTAREEAIVEYENSNTYASYYKELVRELAQIKALNYSPIPPKPEDIVAYIQNIKDTYTAEYKELHIKELSECLDAMRDSLRDLSDLRDKLNRINGENEFGGPVGRERIKSGYRYETDFLNVERL